VEVRGGGVPFGLLKSVFLSASAFAHCTQDKHMHDPRLIYSGLYNLL
jgi:hypothetical protein